MMKKVDSLSGVWEGNGGQNSGGIFRLISPNSPKLKLWTPTAFDQNALIFSITKYCLP